MKFFVAQVAFLSRSKIYWKISFKIYSKFYRTKKISRKYFRIQKRFIGGNKYVYKSWYQRNNICSGTCLFTYWQYNILYNRCFTCTDSVEIFRNFLSTRARTICPILRTVSPDKRRRWLYRRHRCRSRDLGQGSSWTYAFRGRSDWALIWCLAGKVF